MAKTTKSAIVAIAQDLFRRQGFHGTSIQDVAAACGLRKGSLYAHFQGKGELLAAAIDSAGREFDAALRGAMPEAGDWRARAIALVAGAADHLESRRQCVMLHLAFDLATLPEAGRRKVAAFFHRWRDGLAATLAEGMAPEQAGRMAQDTLSALEGATLWLFLDDDAQPLRRAEAVFRQRLDQHRLDPERLAALEPGGLSPSAERVLRRFGSPEAGPWPPVVRRLAEALVEAEERAGEAELMLWRQAEAESCFGAGGA